MSTTKKANEKKIKAFSVSIYKLRKDNQNEVIKVKKNEIKVQPWTTIKELRSRISELNKVNGKNIRIFFKKFELINDLTLNDYHILEKKKPKIYYEIDNKERDFEIKVYGRFPCGESLTRIINHILNGFYKGLNPVEIEDGTSGTYQLRDSDRETVGIFKPFDEEVNAPNNHKNHAGQFGSKTFREGILSGEGNIREVAAYILDNQHIFDVPPTTFVEISHPYFNKKNEELMYTENIEEILKNGLILEYLGNISRKKNGNNNNPYLSSKKYNYIKRKYGSLQQFVHSTGVAADYSYSLFTVEEAHKIMILDFRILNSDRNDENILLIKTPKKDKGKDFYKLIPIDHALSFPSCLKIGDYEMCWMSWSQAEVPFTKEEKEYIKNIDIISDMKRLNENISLREDCWKYFRISNTVLKIGAEYDLTPFEIGSLLYTFDYDKKEKSKIEEIIEKTDNLCSGLKEDKRMKRLFSAGCEEEMDNEEERKNNFTKTHKRRISLLEKTTSEPKNRVNESDSDKSIGEEYDGLAPKNKFNKKRSKKYNRRKLKLSRASSVNTEIVFNSPYNELYFQNFIIYLEELIKEEYPEKAKNYEKKEIEEEEKIINKYEYKLDIIEIENKINDDENTED